MGGAVNAIGNIANAVQGIGNAISSIGNIVSNISGAISNFGNLFGDFTKIFDGIRQRASEARSFDDWANVARSAGNEVGGFLQNASGQVQNIAQPFQQLNSAVQAVRQAF